MTASHHDLIVLGGGPAGYTAAIRAAQLGMGVLCVDDRSSAGGTCLHVGCIPSKALLSSTERLQRARELAEHGISTGELAVDLDVLMRRKQGVVDTLTQGIDQLLEKHGVERVRGRGRLVEQDGIRVSFDEDGDEHTPPGSHVVVATGSLPTSLPGVTIDGDERVVTSRGALSFSSVPEHLVVIGGGYIGLELGSVWSRLGAAVSVVEMEPRLLPQLDEEISEHVERMLEEQGLRLCLEHAVEGIESDGDARVVRLRSGDSDATQELRASHVLVATGRKPASEGLGLEGLGVELTEGGFVRTDARLRTTRPGVYAIGDVAGKPMLAHKGQLEALACVEAIAGRGSGHVSYQAIPAVVYTSPEVAYLGSTEGALHERGVSYRTGRASFRHDARALCTGEAEGFVKLLVEEGSDRLLGAHVLGPHAGSLVHELALLMELGGAVEELGQSPHAHPTLNETLREAALDAHGRAIHH